MSDLHRGPAADDRPTPIPAPQREDGVVLILAIVVIALTVGSAYAFTRSSLLDILGAQQRMDRTRAELLARAGPAMAIRALQEDLASSDPLSAAIEGPRDPWRLLGAGPIEIEGVGELRIEVMDAGQRISLNDLATGEGLDGDTRRQFLSRALERVIENIPGRAEEKRYDPDELADGILDWIDADQQTRLGDEEARFYRDRRARSLPPDRALFSLGELEDVPGMDSRLLDAMDAYFSPGLREPRFAEAGLNPNTAPPHVLALVYIVGAGTFLEDEEVYRVLKARQDGQIFCPSEGADEACVDFASVVNQPGETLYPAISLESAVFLVRSRATVGEASACITSVLDRSEPNQVVTLAYRLDC